MPSEQHLHGKVQELVGAPLLPIAASRLSAWREIYHFLRPKPQFAKLDCYLMTMIDLLAITDAIEHQAGYIGGKYRRTLQHMNKNNDG